MWMMRELGAASVPVACWEGAPGGLQAGRACWSGWGARGRGSKEDSTRVCGVW